MMMIECGSACDRFDNRVFELDTLFVVKHKGAVMQGTDNTVYYKVTYLDNGKRKCSGGHTITSAEQTAKRLQSRGMTRIEIVATNEVRSFVGVN
jgi:hypothetical protein